MLLDLFCGAGGAGIGYERAGFDVLGVDIDWQPNNPQDVVMADAMTYTILDEGYDAIHASPPCQAYSKAAGHHRNRGKVYPDLIAPIRERLRATFLPYIIENVEGAPMVNPITLCGTMFGLELLRHRWFESNIPLVAPPHPEHTGSVGMGDYQTVAGHGGNRADRQRAMGITWMSDAELREAIPPAYTEYLGRQLKAYIMAQRSLAR